MPDLSTDRRTPLRSALITGSTSGIGRATALALADAGVRVIVHGRDEGRGAETVRAIRQRGGSAHLLRAELSSVEEVVDLAARARDVTDGGVDILVNNASEGSYVPTADTSVAEIEHIFAVNVRAPFLLTAALAPAMAERGRGAIINVTAIAASLGVPGLALFGATKGALGSLTRQWAAEYGPSGVRVNSVAPGVVRTPSNDHLAAEMEAFAQGTQAKGPATAEEVAAVIAFMVSPASSYVYGADLVVDGGWLAV